MGEGGDNWKIYETKKAQRVENNKTNKVRASHFCSTASHHGGETKEISMKNIAEKA